FAVQLTYLQQIDRWTDNVPVHLDLPALDLPVSRTGVELHHSPRVRVSLQPGTFRIESDPGVFAEVLRSVVSGSAGFGLGPGFGGGSGGGIAQAAPNPPAPAMAMAAPPPIG